MASKSYVAKLLEAIISVLSEQLPFNMKMRLKSQYIHLYQISPTQIKCFVIILLHWCQLYINGVNDND